MIKNIGIALIAVYVGYLLGLRAQTTYLDKRTAQLLSLQKAIKQRNNQMVENFAQLYSMSEHNENEFTEIDAILSMMWMD